MISLCSKLVANTSTMQFHNCGRQTDPATYTHYNQSTRSSTVLKLQAHLLAKMLVRILAPAAVAWLRQGLLQLQLGLQREWIPNYECMCMLLISACYSTWGRCWCCGSGCLLEVFGLRLLLRKAVGCSAIGLVLLAIKMPFNSFHYTTMNITDCVRRALFRSRATPSQVRGGAE